jgi:hypothetical protein
MKDFHGSMDLRFFKFMKNHTFYAGVKGLLYGVVFASKIKISLSTSNLIFHRILEQYVWEKLLILLKIVPILPMLKKHLSQNNSKIVIILLMLKKHLSQNNNRKI